MISLLFTVSNTQSVSQPGHDRLWLGNTAPQWSAASRKSWLENSSTQRGPKLHRVINLSRQPQRPWEDKSVLDLLLLLPLSSQLFHAKAKVQASLTEPRTTVKMWNQLRIKGSSTLCETPSPKPDSSFSKLVCVHNFSSAFSSSTSQTSEEHCVKKQRVTEHSHTGLVGRFGNCAYTQCVPALKTVLPAPTSTLSFLHFHKLFFYPYLFSCF